LVHGHTNATWSFARIWYAAISLPLYQFLVLRWLWRWAIWTYMLVRLSSQPIKLIGTHPDRAAGLQFLESPVDGFAMFVLAVASVLAGAWGSQLIAGRTTVPSLVPTYIAFVAIALVIGFGPLLLFARQLYFAKLRAVVDYRPFTGGYLQDFHDKWIVRRRAAESPLGSNDIQALNDLGGAFQVVLTTRPFVFTFDQVRDVVIAALIPMVPLVLAVVPIAQLFKRLEVVMR
jgi:hypothetical protein